MCLVIKGKYWCALVDSNHRPPSCEGFRSLTVGRRIARSAPAFASQKTWLSVLLKFSSRMARLTRLSYATPISRDSCCGCGPRVGIRPASRLFTLGGIERHTAGAARKAAREALAQTSLDGVPARAERKKASLTLRAFLDSHYEPWAREHLKTSDETLARLRGNFSEF
jgi:hypothetical protein